MSFCCICGGAGDEQHHLTPVHLGGAVDSPTVYLCGTHHSQVHRIATRVFKGKPIEAKDDNLQNNVAAAVVINLIVRAMQNAENADLSNVPSRIIIKLPKAKLRKVHRRKVDMGFSSLETYILSLIDRDLPE